ncbi:MAG: hypothetical protein AAF799_08570 [Myxococcota bacterium]
MRLPSVIAVPALVGLLSASGGCAAAPAIPLLQHVAQPDKTIVSPPGEDGTRYLSVEGGPLITPRRLQARWNATARKVCEGDFQPLSGDTVTRTANGVTKARIHEGFFQCILPGEVEPGIPGTPTAADATAAAPSGPGRAR